jgi:hypothetical protein
MLSNVLCHAALLSPDTFLGNCRAAALLPAWIDFIPTMTWELSEMCLGALTALLTVDWQRRSPADHVILGKVLSAIPPLCQHLLSEIQSPADDSSEEGDDNDGRRANGGLRDIQADQDWNSDEDDNYCDYDDEEFVDEGAELPSLDVQAIVSGNLQRFGQVQQWQASLTEAERRVVQQYIASAHHKRQDN